MVIPRSEVQANALWLPSDSNQEVIQEVDKSKQASGSSDGQTQPQLSQIKIL